MTTEKPTRTADNVRAIVAQLPNPWGAAKVRAWAGTDRRSAEVTVTHFDVATVSAVRAALEARGIGTVLYKRRHWGLIIRPDKRSDGAATDADDRDAGG